MGEILGNSYQGSDMPGNRHQRDTSAEWTEFLLLVSLSSQHTILMKSRSEVGSLSGSVNSAPFLTVGL